ncbi:MAG: NfeD family protein [Pseudomonadota bacterium]
MEVDTILSSSQWVSAGGIALILIGFSFFVLEFFLPSFGLFGFAGAASILIGVVQLHQTGYIEEMPIDLNILIGLAVLALLGSIAGGIYTYRLYKRQMTSGVEGMIGDIGKVLEWKKTEGRVFVQGENWQAYSDEALSLKKDEEIIISKVEKMRVKIIPIGGDDENIMKKKG